MIVKVDHGCVQYFEHMDDIPKIHHFFLSQIMLSDFNQVLTLAVLNSLNSISRLFS